MGCKKPSPWIWIPLMLVAAITFGAVVMLLWNWLIPDLFNGPAVSLWEAIGLLVLGRLLTGSLPGSHNKWKDYANYKQEWKEKWANLTPEEREALKSRYRHRCKSFSAEKEAHARTDT